MPWTVVTSGVRGSAIATISIDRTDCVCATSGRNSRAIERSERNQSGNCRGSRAPAQATARDALDVGVRKALGRPVHDEHVVAARDEPPRVGERQSLAAAQPEARGDEKDAHASHYRRAEACLPAHGLTLRWEA